MHEELVWSVARDPRYCWGWILRTSSTPQLRNAEVPMRMRGESQSVTSRHKTCAPHSEAATRITSDYDYLMSTCNSKQLSNTHN